MSVLNEPVLVLNKSWTPVDTCTVRTAFSKVFGGTAKFLDSETFQLHEIDTWIEMPVHKDELTIQTTRISLKVPEVMVLTTGIMPRRRTMQFSRRNLARRDHFVCQYCGSKEELTIDHVIPRVRGGKSNWTNCVMACFDCNSKKASKTLEDVGMQLRPRPEMVSAHPHDPKKWTVPYEPAWSPTFKVPEHKLKPSWLAWVNK